MSNKSLVSPSPCHHQQRQTPRCRPPRRCPARSYLGATLGCLFVLSLPAHPRLLA